MTGISSSLTQLQKWQIEPASQMLSRAFINDPSLYHAAPEYSKRMKILHALFHITLAHGIRRGEVYAVSPDIEGIAIWLPSSAPEITLWTLIRHGGLAPLFKVSWKFLWQMKQDDDFATSLRKHHAPSPHWYLAVLGVDPKFQGQGYAGRLLRPMLARLDEEKLPSYLETSVEQYVSLYQHFGFQVISQTQLPGTKTKMWAMLRDIYH